MKTTTAFKAANLKDGKAGDTIRWYDESYMGMRGTIVSTNEARGTWSVRVGNDFFAVSPDQCFEIAGRPFTPPVSK